VKGGFAWWTWGIRQLGEYNRVKCVEKDVLGSLTSSRGTGTVIS
jgi:hypothetical protein